MPTGVIVADNYIDDPNRTTEEVQDALNNALDYLRTLKAEFAALSAQQLAEAAVRGVGAGSADLPDMAILQPLLDAKLSKSDFDPASGGTLEFTGSATSVDATAWVSVGLYAIQTAVSTYIMYIRDINATRVSSNAYVVSSTSEALKASMFSNLIRYEGASKTFNGKQFGLYNDEGVAEDEVENDVPILNIWKL